MTRYMKEKLSPQRLDPLEFWQKSHKLYPNLDKPVRVYPCPTPFSVTCERAFKVAKNVVGGNRVRLRPDNLEMMLFSKYNVRALNNDLDSLQSPPADFWFPYNLELKDPWNSHEESGDDSIADFDFRGRGNRVQ